MSKYIIYGSGLICDPLSAINLIFMGDKNINIMA